MRPRKRGIARAVDTSQGRSAEWRKEQQENPM
jgi:hypothetical protein